MRYEDASNSFQASGPQANDDSDQLPAGAKEAATGNLITGEGTQYGASGADSAAGGHITSIAGKGGEDSSFAGGKLSVAGEFGKLSVDAEGNYNYMANKGAPENVRDRFTYTLADNQGGTDTAALVIELGKTPVVIKADAQQVVPGPDGVVTLPPGVELSDVMVVGRNLVINMPDGTQLIIVDGAVFVPQLVVDGVSVPATNVAALLIGQEPQPAAGELPPSSGGNFALPPPPLDPGVPLGDLIPPTETNYIPPEPQEVLDELDNEPEIFIVPDGQPRTVAAVDQVDEAGLPERNEGEPAGSDEIADGNGTNNSANNETTTGNIVYTSEDAPNVITINGVAVTAVGQQFVGDHGILTITSIAPGVIGYSYTLTDNTSGDNTFDEFAVVLTDVDGDTASASLTIDIIDDTPTARDDTDAVIKGQTSTDGNVMTGDGTTSGASGADTVGADDAELTGIHAGTSGSFTAVTDAGVTIVGQFGDLTIHPDGSYTYTTHAEVGNGGNDVFTYQLTDGDGDTENATLTITVPPDLKPTINAPDTGAGTVVDEAGLPPRGSEPAGTDEAADGNPDNESVDSETTSGVINFTPGDTPATITINGIAVTGVIGQTFSGDFGTLTITGYNANGTINYSYTLDDNTSGDNTHDDFDLVITDVDGDVASDTLRIDIIDDTPLASPDTDVVPGGTYDAVDGNVITDNAAGDVGDGDDGADNVGADDAVVTGVAAGDTDTNLDSPATVGAVIQGDYGKLTLNADGSYTYVRDAGTPGGVEDVFTYTLKDGDGDLVSTTLTIEIENATPRVPQQREVNVVDEAGLPPRDGGETPGTGEASDGNPNNESDDSEIITGVADIGGGDGPLTITIDGVEVTSVGQTFVRPEGILEITSLSQTEIGYKFTLTDNTSGDATSVSFPVTVTDQDGDQASGNFVVSIIDDTPIANDDSNSVSEGGSVDGNVLPNDLPGADNYDPNGAVVGAVVGSNDAVDTTNMPGGGQIVLVGTYGTLTLNEDGSYTYEADPNTNPPADAVDQFVYTIRDGDGDLDSAVLTIDVNDVNLTPDNQNKIVDEAALDTSAVGDLAPSAVTGSNPGSTAESVTGQLNVVGGVSYAIVGSSTGTHGVIQINADGSYKYTLTSPVDGPTANNGTNVEDNVETFTYEATDADGNTVQGTITIDVIDDVPDAAAASTVQAVSVDETAGIQGDSNDTTNAGVIALFSGVSNKGTDGDMPAPQYGQSASGVVSSTGSIYGADGPGTTVFSLNVSSAGVDSGLDTTAGASIFLFKEGNLIVGRVGDSSGPAAFAVAIDPATGVVSMVEYMSIKHPTGGASSPDESVSINDGAILATVTVTDGDGDIDTASVGIGDQIQFQDDAPQAGVASTIQTVSVDETAGIQGDSNDTTNAGVIALFAGVTTKGTDADMPAPQYGQSVSGLVAPTGSSYGADGAGTTVYGLNVSSAGVDSGLDTTAGVSIFLFLENGLVVGRAGATAQAAATGPAAFAVAIDPSTGVVSMVEYMSIKHPTGGASSPDESVSINDGAILATVTVTDGDGDTATNSVGIGDQIQFQDDAPTPGIASTVQTVSVDETAGIQGDSNDTTNAGVIALFAGVTTKGTDADMPAPQYGQSVSGLVAATGSAYGADGAGTTVFGLNVSAAGVDSGLDTTAGVSIFLFLENGLVVGRAGATAQAAATGPAAFAVAIDPSTGVVSMVEYMSIKHPTNPDNDESVSIADGAILATVTVTDGDGDTATSSVGIGDQIQFQDDGPVAIQPDAAVLNNEIGDSVTADLDEDGEVLTDFGADGPGLVQFANIANGDDTGFTSGGDEIHWFLSNNDQTLQGRTNSTNGVDGELVFTVSINQATGEYTVTMADTIDNGSGVEFTDLSGGVAGNPPFKLITEDGVDLELLATPIGTNSVNSDSDDIAVGSQFIEFNDGIRFDFGDFTYVNEGGTTNDDMFQITDNSQSINGFKFTIDQVSNGTTADFKLTAIDADDDGHASQAVIGADADDVIDPITKVIVYDTNGDVVAEFTGTDTTTYSFDVTFNGDGTVNFDGLPAQYSVQTYTAGEGYNRLVVFNDGTASPDGKFSLSELSIETVQTGDPLNLSLDLKITDGDGDPVTMTDAINITLNPAGTPTLLSTFASFANQEEQLQKTAANSNTLTLATAVAAAGYVEPVAAHDNGNHNGHGQNSDTASFATVESVERYSASDDDGSAAVSMLAPEASNEASDPVESSNGSSSAKSEGGHSVDDSSAHAAPESNDAPAADGGSEHSSADAANPVAPTVAMVSAEALQAAANDGVEAQKGGSVEQIVADAMQHGGGHDIDAVLANLPGGNGALQAIAHMASPEAAAVSGWHMAGHGAGGAGFDMMFKMDVATHHQDAVQPVANG